MIEEYAVVTERAENTATLEIERRTACSLCGQKRGCGNATWGKLLGHKKQTISAENVIDAKVGDSVVVGIDERALLGTVFYLYVVPLLTLLVGAVLAEVLFDNEFYVILAALSGLVLGFMWVKGHLVGYGQNEKIHNTKFKAVILRHADDSSACENARDVNGNSADSHDADHDSSIVKFKTKRGE